MTWNDQFLALYRHCLKEYREGNNDFTTYYTPADVAFLSSIGYRPRELFDFVEDLVEEGEPSESTALLIAAVRRDYFLVVQDGVASETRLTANGLPTFGDRLDEMAYFPRLIKKARAKLTGELDQDLMFCCGGDRKFLREHGNIPPSDFLRQVWASLGDDEKIAAYVRKMMA